MFDIKNISKSISLLATLYLYTQQKKLIMVYKNYLLKVQLKFTWHLGPVEP